MAKNSIAAVQARARQRQKALVADANTKLQQHKARAKLRETSMVVGAIVGGVAVAALPAVSPATAAALKLPISKTIKVARSAAVGAGAAYYGMRGKRPALRGAAAAVAGAYFGDTIKGSLS